MPEIGRIQSTNFQSLLTDLGITRNNIPFGLQSEVMPVVLVGGTVSFIAAATPSYRVQDIFTAGPQIAPAINFVLADTGPLAPGSFGLLVFVQMGESARFEFQWRNAANSANLWVQEFSNFSGSGDLGLELNFRFEVENQDERFRVQLPVAATAGIRYQGTILARP